MTNTTTDAKRKRGPSLSRVLTWSLFAQLIVGGAIWLAEPLRKTQKTFDPSQIEEQAEQAKARNKARLAKEEARRQRTALREEDARILKQREREKRKRELAKKLDELRELEEEARRTKEARLEELQSRRLETFNAAKDEGLMGIVGELKWAARVLWERSREPLAKSAPDRIGKLGEGAKAFVKAGSAEKRDQLVEQAKSVRDALGEQIGAVRKMRSQEADTRGVGLFIHDAHMLNLRLDKFIAHLATYDGFDDDFVAEMNAIPEQPEESSGADTAVEEASLEEVMEEISEKEQAIESHFDDFRAAELAMIEGKSFSESRELIEDMREQQTAAELDQAIAEAEEAVTEAEQSQAAANQASEQAQAGAQAAPKGDKVDESQADSSQEKTDGQQASQEEAAAKAAEAQTTAEKKQAEAMAKAQEAVQKAQDAQAGAETEKEKASAEAKAEQAAQIAAKAAANAQSKGSPSAPASGSGIKTIADLNKYRSQLARAAQGATNTWVRARNTAHQMGAFASSGKKGQSAKPFQQRNHTGTSAQRSKDGGGSKTKSDGGNVSSKDAGAGTLKTANGKQSRRPQQLQTKIPVEAIKAKALPGRRFSKESERAGWLYLDAWYVIGPWGNHGRLDYTVNHPPELSVDFDAVYPNGKIDRKTNKPRKLRWKFIQSDRMRITPPDEREQSTYYAFTEVYFDEATEMLVAIASDDAARMWVNDALVWEDHGLSSWNLNEGFKRIKFKKGFNKILARIESGPGLCEYSVLLCPPDQIK